MAETVRLMLGDCVERMGEIDDSSVNAIITDPPYPCVDRSYGRMTEAEWHSMMDRLIPECRRVLKPTGSAVFVLQPNSERVGQMRPWLWEFMAKWCRDWGIVQDVYWWRHDTMPTEGAPHMGMLRQSVKACVWLGPHDCYRDQQSVLWEESDYNKVARLAGRCDNSSGPSRARTNTTPVSFNQKRVRKSAGERGGVTPFNVLVYANGSHRHGHPAPTSPQVSDWWVRYISPPGGVVLDPFVGSGTVALAALAQGRSAIGIERDAGYFQIATDRIAAAQAATPLLSAAQ